jgi:hypothetical protein
LTRNVIIPIGGTRPPDPDNQCNLCKRVVPPSHLIRCPRCKKLFCRSCITEDLGNGEYLICLNCARRYISPRVIVFKSKYTPLTLFLTKKAKWKKWLKLQFSQIEGLLGKDLPEVAYKSDKWWTNRNSVHYNSWNTIGWKIKEVNIKEKTIIFIRPDFLRTKKEKKSKKKMVFEKLPEYRSRKKKIPSLTKIAIAQAKLQNISRRKSSMRKYRGKFRPKSAYEKRLWKADEEP